MKKNLLILTLLTSASMAMAAITTMTNITVTVLGSDNTLVSLTGNGNTYLASGLATGTSTASTNWVVSGVTNYTYDIYPLPRMDDPFTSTIEANPGNKPSGTSGTSLPIRTVLFNGQNWTNSNGALLDFFIIEASTGSGDAISVAAIFPDNTIGIPTNIVSANWTNAGVLVGGTEQASQLLCGVGFSITDLRTAGASYAATTTLPDTTTIKGIAIMSGGGVDPAGVWASVVPSGIDHYNVDFSPAMPVDAGEVFDITISARDSSNVLVPNTNVIVSVTGGASLMEFDWNSDGTYGDTKGTLGATGEITIKARDKKAETNSVVAFGGGASSAAAPFEILPLAFSQLQVLLPGEFGAPGTTTGKTGTPTTQSVGIPFNVTVNAVDQYWNFLNTVSGDNITLISTNATPIADVALASGVATFSGVVFTASSGGAVLVATNNSNILIPNAASAPVLSSMALIWQGDGVNNLWDIGTTASWTNLLGVAGPFNNGDRVTFDDTGSYSPAVNIQGSNTPSAVILNTVNNVTFSSTTGGQIGGSTSVRKIGAGNLTINNSNSYSGGTAFTDGTFTVGHSNAVPNSGELAFTNTTVVLNANLIHNSGSTRITGNASLFGGGITFAAAGGNRTVILNNLTWGGSGDNLFRSALSCSITLGRASDNTTLEFGSQIQLSPGQNIGGSRTFIVPNGSQPVDVLFSGRLLDETARPITDLRWQGGGTIQLSHNNNNFEGPTFVELPKMIVSGGSTSFGGNKRFTLGDGTSTSVTLQLGAANTNVNVTFATLATSGSGTYRVVGGHPTLISTVTLATNSLASFNGIFGGPGANENNLGLSRNGSNSVSTLMNANTYIGPTTITSGTLALSGSGSISGSTNITINAGGTLDVSGVSFALGSAQLLRGGGAVSGNVTVNGTVEPGTGGIGTLTFTNDLTFNAGATNRMEVNANLTCDRINVAGTLTGAGQLIVTKNGTATLTNGSVWQLFSGPVTGFTVTLPTATAGTMWANNLAVNGTIGLVTNPSFVPDSITPSIVNGTNLSMIWPAGVGYVLQARTNGLTTGAGWFVVTNAPPFVTTIDPANGSVYYRLRAP